MTNYDYYNREERAICAHLFRLLHEQLDDKSRSPLGKFLDKLSHRDLTWRNGNNSLTNLRFDNTALFCEASIIRDAYQNSKPDTYPFMDTLTRLIMKQESVTDCRLYSQLPEPLNNGKKTHPKQIRQKATADSIQLTEGESRVYGAMQGNNCKELGILPKFGQHSYIKTLDSLSHLFILSSNSAVRHSSLTSIGAIFWKLQSRHTTIRTEQGLQSQLALNF